MSTVLLTLLIVAPTVLVIAALVAVMWRGHRSRRESFVRPAGARWRSREDSGFELLSGTSPTPLSLRVDIVAIVSAVRIVSTKSDQTQNLVEMAVTSEGRRRYTVERQMTGATSSVLYPPVFAVANKVKATDEPSEAAGIPTFFAVCAALRNVRRNPEWRFVREVPRGMGAACECGPNCSYSARSSWIHAWTS